MKKKALRGAAIGGAAFVVALVLHILGVFLPLEWKTWDARMRLFANPKAADPNIVLVLVDQYSLDVYAKQSLSWPWPRQMYAALIRYFIAGKAAACFFDITMSEASGSGPEDDQAFAEAAAEAGNVFLPVALSAEDRESDEAEVELLSRFSLGESARPKRVAKKTFLSATTPLADFLKSARGIGNVQVNPDEDGIYRRMPLAFSFRKMILPSGPLALAELVGDKMELGSIPIDRSGHMLIRFVGPAGTYRAYPIATLINSYAQILENKAPQISPREFAGKTVLVGLSAVGLHDIKSSPLSGVISGVEVQAAALDTLLHRSFIRFPPNPIVWIFGLLVAVLAGITISSLRKVWAMTASFAGFLALPAGAAVVAFASGFWLEFVFPETGVLIALGGGALFNYGVEGKQRRFIKSVFRHYLSPAVIERILEQPGLLKLGGEEREISSLFSDVVSFTAISERLAPSDLVSLLNEYLSEMTNLILDEGGTLDKYEGDAIVAFWNAPLDVADHAFRACRAALACRRRLQELGVDFAKRFGGELKMRIGLNTGPAVVGNMGSSRRFDYTAMGDTVNLAARLEGACKQYHVSILIGELTHDLVKDRIATREVDVVRVVGKKQPVRIFELVAEIADLGQEEAKSLEEFNRAQSIYRTRDWHRAAELFEGMAGGDPLARLYAERCRGFELNPPPEGWDLVYELTSK
jgi:adenylate cyclase